MTKPIMRQKYQKTTVSDMKTYIGVRLSMKHGVIKRRYELYFGIKCGFLFIRLVICAIIRHARSSGFWVFCYGNSGAIGLNKILEYFVQNRPFDASDYRLRSISSGLVASDTDAITCDTPDEVGSRIMVSMDDYRYTFTDVFLQKAVQVRTLALL